jgi:hypothetical protein
MSQYRNQPPLEWIGFSYILGFGVILATMHAVMNASSRKWGQAILFALLTGLMALASKGCRQMYRGDSVKGTDTGTSAKASTK